MKRWWYIAEGLFFLLIAAFVISRFWGVRTLWTGLDDLRPHFIPVARFALVAAAISLLILRSGNILWKKIQHESPASTLAESQRSSGVHWRHVVELGVLSIVLALIGESLTSMQTPGTFFRGEIFMAAHAQNLTFLPLYFLMPIVVDAAVLFAAIWGGYMLWIRLLRAA